MGCEESLHKKMVKIVLGGVAPIEENQALSASEIKKSWRPSFQRIQSFFAQGVEELRRDLNKAAAKKENKTDSQQK